MLEKQTLLQEVHHRVKNNLQIISSLLSMQASLIEDKTAVAKLADSERRVRSMAMIHEHLYHQKDMSSIDLAEYLRDMTADLSSSVGNAGIVFRLEASSVAIPIDQAIPCGLLLNELVTNALKYAYPTGTGEILLLFVGRSFNCDQSGGLRSRIACEVRSPEYPIFGHDDHPSFDAAVGRRVGDLRVARHLVHGSFSHGDGRTRARRATAFGGQV